MRLLLTNDDGIDAKGIYTLAKVLEKEHEVIIAAPSSQKSATSHSITIANPLTIKSVKLKNLRCKAFSISGTPADCVRIALDKLLDEPVDMVISGMNYGINLGIDVIYSGTVSAAIEAAIQKIPSVAISCEVKNKLVNFESAAKLVPKILNTFKNKFLKNDLVLNVNIPYTKGDFNKEIKVCKIGDTVYTSNFEKLEDKDTDMHFLLKGKFNTNHIDKSDVFYLYKGYVTITPLHYDLTNFSILNEVSKWF